jgi:hypothetical protein
MMKVKPLLTLIPIALAVLLQVPQPHRLSPNEGRCREYSRAARDHQASKDTAEGFPSLLSADQSPGKNTQTESPPKSTEHGYWAKVFAPELLSNWALAAVGAMGIIFGAVTLWFLYRQVVANELAAKAAQESAASARIAAEVASRPRGWDGE